MTSDKSYDVKIDVVRFCAFFLVFFTHFVNSGGNALSETTMAWWNQDPIQRFADFGGQGVPIFFALTGFLLGRLMLRESKLFSTISISKFYARRILRIWPLYFLFIAICFAANPFASGTPAINSSEIPFLITFTYNWGQIYSSLPGSMATITWSISVEEQIYLIFPLLFSLTRKPKFKFVTFLFILLGILTLLLVDFGFLPSAERQTTSYLLPVGVGLFVAIYESTFRKHLIRKSWLTFVVTFFVIAYPWLFREFSSVGMKSTTCMTLTSLYFVALLHLCDRFINQDIALARTIGRIGRISYGCYLYHWAVWTVMTGKEILYTPTSGFSLLGVVVALALTITISEISYRYFESWFLQKRKLYQRVVSP